MADVEVLRPKASAVWAAAIYVAMLLGAIGLFLVVRYYGNALIAPGSPIQEPATGTTAATSNVLWHLLLALATVVILGRLVGSAFRVIGQPPVIGEVVAGILLGPSLLGSFAPDAYAYLLPSNVAPYLGVLAQIGVVVYMFLVGVELNPDLLRGHLHTTIATSHAGIVLPFTLGSGLALYLYPRFSTMDVPFTNFALFSGVAMSITAFPVLARILADRGMTRTKLGALALTCAAVDDVTAWCLLAFVVGVVQGSGGSVIPVALLTLGFIAVMFVLVRPLFERLAASAASDASRARAVTIALISMIGAALVTEAIGVHAIFGAFLLGAVIPHESELARSLKQGVGDLVTILFLPAFFAFTGMRTQIGLLSGPYEWTICALIVFVATIGKFGGAFVAARATGLDWRNASALGALMNTRGLMELIVLNVGLDLGVISPTLFTMLVLMAIATTMATTPALRMFVGQSIADGKRPAVARG